MKEGREKIGGFTTALFTVVFSLLLMAATAYAAEGPAVMITGYTVEPEVLMPGDTGTITLTIKNMDTQSLETTVEQSSSTPGKTTTTTSTRSISAEIETIRLSSRSEYIEWLKEGTQRTEYFNVGALGPGESITVSLPIKAAAYARGGTYFPEVYIEVDNGDNVRFPVRVQVDSSELQLLEQDIPSEISISESKEIAIVVANNRPNTVSGVTVFVKSSNDNLKFTPEGVFIGKLEAYEQKEIKFTLTPLSEGDHEIYFEATYKNGNNVHHSELTSSVSVKSSSDVKLILVNAPEYVFKNDVARIDFDVANGMAKDIKAVSVVPAMEGLKILPSEYFIGDMEAGDVFSASFDLHTSDLNAGDLRIPFKVLFKDVDTGKQYETEGYEVHVEVKESQKSELPNQMLLGAILVILLLVVVVVWMRVKRRRGR
ncbi:MAG: COG1361 S-layer family protein [Candidatus Methanospirareceae archaeon]